ncbi:MAG: hypothetical protein KKE91_03650, partial [Candidatus Omnitrophica bacterium]|nr:hypothetical protein [Candidatus Omnitrophota bacterium]
MKITRATLKKFIKDHKDNLYIEVKTSFDGMIDCISEVKGDFTPVKQAENPSNYNLGIQGLWLVGQSRDYFTKFED